MLVITRKAATQGLPLSENDLLTKGSGQVSGLSKANVQAILEPHGITRTLAREGGRTSRGNLGLMRKYVELVNSISKEDLEDVEAFWVSMVESYFQGKPFRIRWDSSHSLRRIISDLLAQAESRQQENVGTMYVGAVMQHLVGAKLDLLTGGIEQHFGHCVADVGTGRDSDFPIGDTCIHVTSSPSEALIEKCGENISSGQRPLIVTRDDGCRVALSLARNKGLEDRIDVVGIEQFLTANLVERGGFSTAGTIEAARAIIDRYNTIIDSCESDNSLKINWA